VLRYWVYTDASCDNKENLISSAFVIRTKWTYIASESRVFEGGSIAEAETIAIGLAVEKIMQCVQLDPDDEVRIASDSQSAIDFIKKVCINGEYIKSNDKRVILTCKKVQKLQKMCKVKFVKTYGHAKLWNGNSSADRLARHSLRVAVAEGSGK